MAAGRDVGLGDRFCPQQGQNIFKAHPLMPEFAKTCANTIDKAWSRKDAASPCLC